MTTASDPLGPGAGAGTLLPHQREIDRLSRWGLGSLGVAILPAVAWLALAPLSSAVVASAFVKVDLDRRPVQHAEGGMVAEVRVRDGQRVRRGEPLLVLGDVSVAADMNRLSLRVLAEQVTVARLEAEQRLASSFAIAPAVVTASRTDARLAEQIAKERALFLTRRRSLDEQVQLLREQQLRVRKEIDGLSLQITEAELSLGHQRSELETNRRLQKDGFISTTRIAQLEATVADYTVKLGEKRSDLARAEQKIVDADLRIKGLQGQYLQQAGDELKESLQRLSELQQEHRKTTDAASRQVIVAPADGDVMGLKFTTPGAVIAPRETIADIVPAGSPLLVEAQIRPEDIRQVRTGQPVDIRFTAFNPRTTPSVDGRVVYVSADRNIDPSTQLPFYVAQIEADPSSMDRAGGLQLRAGMPAEVFVRGETRTPLEYLVEPIKEVLRRSAREH